MKFDDAVRMVANYKGELKKFADVDVDHVCEILDLKPGEAMHFLIFMFMKKQQESVMYRDKYLQIERENEYLHKCIQELGKDGREVQKTKVKVGMPIAKKAPKIMEMKLLEKCGADNEELMEHFGISRTTLWRWRKMDNKK